MTVDKVWTGQTQNGQAVARYTLRNKNDVTVDVLNLGGIVTSICVPDKHGNLADIVLGYDSVSEYENDTLYFGALVGRLANRVSKGKFTIDGTTYTLAVNNGPNHLHGGPVGFHKKVWSAEIIDDKLKLSLASPDGEEGYPGDLNVCVTYDLNSDNELVIGYSATTTKATPVNLTNHSYFNLAGHGSGNVYDQTVCVHAGRYTPKTDNGIPTGEVVSVADTLFDLRQPVRLGDRINKISDDIGYDHNLCLEAGKEKDKPLLAATLEHRGSGRRLEVYTTQPGLQLYTANYVNDVVGKGGVIYPKHAAVCFETQNYPNAINQSNFPTSILRPGDVYAQTTVYKFLTK